MMDRKPPAFGDVPYLEKDEAKRAYEKAWEKEVINLFKNQTKKQLTKK